MRSFLKNLWDVAAHLPPLIVAVPFRMLFFVWKWFSVFVEIFGHYTFKLQYTLTPECCRPKIVRVENVVNDR